MRRVTFSLGERLTLVPVELIQSAAWVAPLLGLLLLAGGVVPGGFSRVALLERAPATAGACAGALLAGSALTPLLLPWIPGRAFAVKGGLLGALWDGVAAGLLLRAVAGRAARRLGGAPDRRVRVLRHAVHRLLGHHLALRRPPRMRYALPLQIAGVALGAALLVPGRLLAA